MYVCVCVTCAVSWIDINMNESVIFTETQMKIRWIILVTEVCVCGCGWCLCLWMCVRTYILTLNFIFQIPKPAASKHPAVFVRSLKTRGTTLNAPKLPSMPCTAGPMMVRSVAASPANRTVCCSSRGWVSRTRVCTSVKHRRTVASQWFAVWCYDWLEARQNSKARWR